MNIFDIVLNSSFTNSQLRKRAKLLKAFYLDQIYHSKNFSESNFEREDVAWFSSLDKALFKDITEASFTQDFAELDKQISTITPLVIYLPFDLPNNELDKIGVWLRKNINPQVVFEVKADYDLIGGCRLVWRGISRDYSLKAQIEAKKDDILASFTSAFK